MCIEFVLSTKIMGNVYGLEVQWHEVTSHYLLGNKFLSYCLVVTPNYMYLGLH